jgi:hypothetical protein
VHKSTICRDVRTLDAMMGQWMQTLQRED